MRRLFQVTIIIMALAFIGGGNAFAYPVAAGDVIYFQDSGNGSNTGGGEFLIKDAGSHELLFTTFCLEYSEHIGYNRSYTVQGISDRAFGGGGDIDDSAPGDPLSDATKWLYWNFVTGELDDSGLFDYNDDASYDALQYAIWFLEDEKSVDQSAGLVAYANTIVGATDYVFEGDVAVMNLGDHQDQLIAGAAPVPEPATLLLLATGLSGLAFWRRKMKK